MKKLIKTSLAVAAIALLASCGGGGSSLFGANPSLSGVAAVGAPMSGATMTLVDAAGRTYTTTAGADGSYSFSDLSGAVAPFQLQATATMGETDVTHFALVPSNSVDAVANVTPLTTAITALISPSDIPVPLSASQLAAISSSDISGATSKVNTVIAPLVAGLNLPSSFDPLQTNFTANGTGADLLLDHLAVTIRPEGVTIANKMAVVASTADSTSTAGSQIVKNSSAVPTALTETAVTNTNGFDELAAKFTECFTVARAERLVATSSSAATLHVKCQGLASDSYLHNGVPFMNRWAKGFRATSLVNTVFARPVVRLRISEAIWAGTTLVTPERIAVNFNFKDVNGAGYTTPEIIERQIDGSWLLVGNQREFNGYVESQLTYYNDLANLPYNNVNSSRVDAGFRILFDPRTYIGSNGSVTYGALDLMESGGFNTSSWGVIDAAKPAGAKMVGCVVVRGPGEMVGAKWAGFHPNGILLKRPNGSTVQDYMGIDRVVTNGWRAAINATPAQADGSAAAPSYTPTGGTLLSNICDNSRTDSSSSTYVTDLQALGARANLFTGAANDATIAGRDPAWNTSARYARLSPSATLAATLDANPKLTLEVFDTDGKLRFVLNTRYLGEMPPASMAKTYVDNNMVSVISTESLKRYLDFAAGASTTSTTVTGSVDLNWNTPTGAFGADRIGLYSEIYRSIPGNGIRGPLSTRGSDASSTSSLWTSDADLAAYLDAIAGTGFFWWNGSYAKLSNGADTGSSCAGTTSLVSTSGVNVGRSMTSIGSSNAYAGYLFGTTALNAACIAPGTTAYVHREVFTTTYTDTNTRLYVFTANKALRN
jgi:hypothetical protein